MPIQAEFSRLFRNSPLQTLTRTGVAQRDTSAASVSA